MLKRYTLMIPGPTEVPEQVLVAMGEQVYPHYESEWAEIYWGVIEDLKKVCGTESDVFLINGSGTLSAEICLASLLAPGDKVLSIANCGLGRGMGGASEGFGATSVYVECEQWKPVPPEVVRSYLEKEEFQMVVAGHHDTGSGFLNPMDEIGAVCREFDVPFLSDAVSSLGGVPFKMDEWGVDFLCSSVQKCFDCPPGLAVVAVSEKAWRKMEAKGDLHRGRYMNLLKWRASAQNARDWHPTMVTAATSNIMGLRESLKLILAEGLEARVKRFARLGALLRTGLKNLGLTQLVEDQYSPLVTGVVFPEGIDAVEARDFLRYKYNILTGRGGESYFRIPNFGSKINEDRMTLALIAIEDFLRRKGQDIPAGTCLKGLEAFRE